MDVPNIPHRGARLGNWLTRAQAKELLAVPDRSTLKGKRDYVILAPRWLCLAPAGTCSTRSREDSNARAPLDDCRSAR